MATTATHDDYRGVTDTRTPAGASKTGWSMMEPVRTGILRATAAEFVGMTFFIWVSVSAAYLTGGVLPTAIAFGLTLGSLVYALGGISGGHFNPNVSFSLFLTRRISLLRCVLYILAQMLGAMLGAALARGMASSLYLANGGGANAVNYSITSNGGAFLGEFLGAAILAFIVNCACDLRHTDNVTSAIFIGYIVVTLHLALISLTGCSINPARSFGTSVVTGNWSQQWIWWVAGLCGSIFAALVYEAVGRSALIAPDASTANAFNDTASVATGVSVGGAGNHLRADSDLHGGAGGTGILTRRSTTTRA